MSRWIKCSERLPEQDEFVLVVDRNRMQWIMRLSECDQKLYWSEGDCELDFEEVTHWMPLPEPPKEGKEK